MDNVKLHLMARWLALKAHSTYPHPVPKLVKLASWLGASTPIIYNDTALTVIARDSFCYHCKVFTADGRYGFVPTCASCAEEFNNLDNTARRKHYYEFYNASSLFHCMAGQEQEAIWQLLEKYYSPL